MVDRDVAEVLLAHCQAGIELTRAIASLKVSSEVAALAASVNRDEESDRAAILAWVATQQAQPSAVATIQGTETRTSHAAIVEQLRTTSPSHLDEHVMRVLLEHHNEELTVMNQTPAKDKSLRTIIEAIWRRLSDEVKTLSLRLPSTGAD
jgi:uncharacterized protein (DUF305 family)